MAKVIQPKTQSVVIEPWWARIRIIYIGLALGLFWWLVALILQNYIVEPWACRDLATAATCVNAGGISGNISAVLTAVLGTWALIRFRQPRPIVVAIAAAVLLWDLGFVLDGLSWWVIALWGLFFYTTSYALFSLVSQIRRFAFALILTIVLVVGIRLLLIL